MPIQLKHMNKHDTSLTISFENTKEGETALLTVMKRGHLGCVFEVRQELDCGSLDAVGSMGAKAPG